MKNELLKILLVGFVLFCLVGAVSASENITDSQSICDDGSLTEDMDILTEGSDDSPKIYVNSSKETNGDGSSWDEAFNGASSWNEVHYDDEGNKIDNCTVYLADGEYAQANPLSYSNCTFIGQGNSTRISFFADNNHDNYNSRYTFINLAFVKKINEDDGSTYVANLCANYDFINCTFIDLPMSKKGWPGSTIATFDNCLFANASQSNLIINKYYANLKFENCIFDNVSADCIVRHEDSTASTLISDSCFRNCNVNGILKLDSENYNSHIINCTYDDNFNLDYVPVNAPYYFNITENLVIYVNSSRENSGDGRSWENAAKSYKVHKGLTVYLSEGNYSFSGKDCTVIGMGDKTIINDFWGNSNVTVINATFDSSDKHAYIFNYVLDSDYIYYSISASGKFVNCTFINESFFLGYPDPLGDRFRDSIPDVSSVYFENCSFINFSSNEEINEWDVNTSWGEIQHNREFESKVLFDSYMFSKVFFNNCLFENISCECIIDSLGGQIDYNGISDGAYIYNSTFNNCDVVGIIKARQANYCAILNCTYDFPVSADIPLVGPFYINSTDRPVIQTYLDVVADGNSLIITLTDGQNNPMVDYEVEIVTNGRVSYEYTDENGKIVLSNLVGNYSFEISYPGDDYEGYAPVSVNKSFSFAEIGGNDTNGSNSTPVAPTKVATKLTASKVTATYNVAKKLVITLKDKNGKALANKKVTVKVGSISKTLTTNSKGQVSLNVATLVPKTYTATISFKEDANYKGSSLSSKVTVSKGAAKLAAKSKTFKAKAKTKKLSVTLKDSKNRALNGKKLTIKVNGKTYTAKTNKKGVATFRITKLSKKGTFKSKIAFKGDKWYKAISKNVKIKVK